MFINIINNIALKQINAKEYIFLIINMCEHIFSTHLNKKCRFQIKRLKKHTYIFGVSD